MANNPGLGTIVYFHCEDCAVEAARIAPAGGTVKDQKMSIGQYGFIVLAYDTEGKHVRPALNEMSASIPASPPARECPSAWTRAMSRR